MKFLTLSQFEEMWRLQDELNSVVAGPDWRNKKLDWNLAIKDEVMEFFTYIGWKWWKEPEKVKSPADMQARLEAVDIWHFLLSHISEITNYSPEEEWANINTFLETKETTTLIDCRRSIKQLDHLNVNNFVKVLYLSDMLQLCEWSWDELYKAYIGKVALNNFRQANGYKEGTYKKLWTFLNGVETEGGIEPTSGTYTEEDNFFLERILQDLSTPPCVTYANVYESLHTLYNSQALE